MSRMNPILSYLLAGLHLDPVLGQGSAQGTVGGPVLWFGLAVIVFIIGMWTVNSLRRRDRPPPMGGPR